jgi:flagellar basal body-associated protein FliL
MKRLFAGKRKFALIGVLVLLLGAGYTMTKPHPKVVMKVKGTVYQLPKSFLINLTGGQFAKVNVALILDPGQPASAEGAAAASSGEEKGTLPEEPLVRAIITNALTGQRGEVLLEERARVGIEHQILKQINERTDVKVEAILFPDLTVQ